MELSKEDRQLIELTTRIVVSGIDSGIIDRANLAQEILNVFSALSATRYEYNKINESVAAPTKVPAVPINQSVTPDYLICLEDGQKFKILRPHLRRIGMTPDQYRMRWNLPSNYPMVAENYSSVRSKFAKFNGLGRKMGERKIAGKMTFPKS